MWDAVGSSGLTVSREIVEGSVSGTKEGVAVVAFLVGCDARIWLEVEREPVFTTYEM
jgi:hypothetical protein